MVQYPRGIRRDYEPDQETPETGQGSRRSFEFEAGKPPESTPQRCVRKILHQRATVGRNLTLQQHSLSAEPAVFRQKQRVAKDP